MLPPTLSYSDFSDAVKANTSSAFATTQGCHKWSGVEALHAGRSTQDRMKHIRNR